MKEKSLAATIIIGAISIDMLESCASSNLYVFNRIPSSTFLPSRSDKIHLRFWINAAHYCSSNLQKLTQESEWQIGDFISQKTFPRRKVKIAF